MQQRQLRLGDILDDYCPRDVTNHVIVAMIVDDVKQTRCTTCDADHEYKHAKVPRQRRKSETPAVLYSQVAATAPKRVAHEHHHEDAPPSDVHDVHDLHDLHDLHDGAPQDTADPDELQLHDEPLAGPDVEAHALDDAEPAEEGREESGDLFMHRPLIRAQLPRHEGQPARERQATDFTIRQPAGRPGRFRPRTPRAGGQQPFGSNVNRGNGGGNGNGNGNGNYGQSMRSGTARQQGGRPGGAGNSAFRPGRSQGPAPGRKRSR